MNILAFSISFLCMSSLNAMESQASLPFKKRRIEVPAQVPAVASDEIVIDVGLEEPELSVPSQKALTRLESSSEPEAIHVIKALSGANPEIRKQIFVALVFKLQSIISRNEERARQQGAAQAQLSRLQLEKQELMARVGSREGSLGLLRTEAQRSKYLSLTEQKDAADPEIEAQQGAEIAALNEKVAKKETAYKKLKTRHEKIKKRATRASNNLVKAEEANKQLTLERDKLAASNAAYQRHRTKHAVELAKIKALEEENARLASIARQNGIDAELLDLLGGEEEDPAPAPVSEDTPEIKD